MSATVDTHNRVTGIAFPINACEYMASAELANVVCETVRKAQAMAREELAGLEPMMPVGAVEAMHDHIASGNTGGAGGHR